MSTAAVFRYRAATADGKTVVGKVIATSSAEARRHVEAHGLLLIEFSQGGRPHHTAPRIGLEDWAVGLSTLAALLESGVPLSKSLQAMQDVAPRSWRRILPTLEDSVARGQSLSTAIGNATGAAPAVLQGILHAGEAGSGLTGALRRAADLIMRQHAARVALWNALTYPLVLLAVGTASVSLLVTFVLPRFAEMLLDVGASLPASTRIMLAAGDIAREGLLSGLAIAIVGYISVQHWLSDERRRAILHDAILDVPWVGAVRRAKSTAEMAETLGALLETGVPLAAALQWAGGATPDMGARRRLAEAGRCIEHGSPLADALRKAAAFTVAATQMVAAAERTGDLPRMLKQAASMERLRLERRTQLAAKVIEPVIILLFGSLVALLAASLLQAVYGVRPL